MLQLVVRASTDLEAEVFRRFCVGVAAEILVDNVLIFAGTGLEEEVRSRLVQRQVSRAFAALEQSCWLHGHLIWSVASAEDTRGRIK